MNAPRMLPVMVRSNAQFPRSARLLLSRDFQNVFNQKANFVGKYMVVWMGEGRDDGLRLGVIASKRTFRRAVDRNRAKRLLREAFRLNRSRVAGKGDLVIIARRRILEVKCQAVEKELMWLLKKSGITNSSPMDNTKVEA